MYGQKVMLLGNTPSPFLEKGENKKSPLYTRGPRAAPGDFSIFADVLLVASVDAIGIARLPRLLHDANLRVMLLGRPGLAVGRSRFVHRYLRTSNDPAEIIRVLQRHLHECLTPYRLVILADDPLLWAATGQAERLWMQSWFPVALTEHAVAQITSKIHFIEGAFAFGLPLPRFHTCATVEEARSAAKHVGYPVVLKTAHGFSGSAVRFIQNADDLMEQARGFVQGQSFIVQEFIKGEVGATPVLFDRGRPVWWFSYLLLDPWPNRFAAASALEIVNHPDVKPLLDGIGAFTGFHGIGAIDWVRDPRTDRLLLIEFNPRPTPALYLGACEGVRFSTALRAWLAGGTQIPHSHVLERTGRKRLMFPQHLYPSIDALHPGRFLSTWRDAPWNDPLLLAAQLRRVITHYLPSSWRQRAKAVRATLKR